MTSPLTPITATTDEVIGALRWAISHAQYAAYNLSLDRKISSHIAKQKSRELQAHSRALHEMLKSVQASRAEAPPPDVDPTE